MPFGICIADGGRIIYRNPAQNNCSARWRETRLGGSPAVGRGPQAYLAACGFTEEHPKPVEALELRFHTGRGQDNFQHLTWMNCSIHPIDYGGRKKVIAMVDLTRIKELERRVRIRGKIVSLGHVAAGIAHEIRNPLFGHQCSLEGIRENFTDPKRRGYSPAVG